MIVQSDEAKSEVDTDVQSEPTRLPEPTLAWPGSAEKVAVLAARAEAGELLWHPQDPVIVDTSKQLRHRMNAG